MGAGQRVRLGKDPNLAEPHTALLHDILMQKPVSSVVKTLSLDQRD